MPAFSGADLRIRDKAIEDKHRKEISALEAKVQRVKHAYDDISNKYHAYKNQGADVATELGFHSLDEVQTFMKIADEQMPYKGLAEHVDALTAELSVERRDNEDLRDELLNLREERDALKAALAQNESARLSESTGHALAKELVDLRTRLYTTEEQLQRGQKYFNERFIKWRVFKQFFKDQEEEFKAKTKGLRTAEKMRPRAALFLRRSQKLKEMGLDSDDDTELQKTLGLQDTPIQTTKPRSSITPTFANSPTVIASGSTPSSTHEGGAKLPKIPALSSRTPLQFESVHISRPSIADQYSSPGQRSAPIKSTEVIDVSDTEDDSQGSITFVNSTLPAKPVLEHHSQDNEITLISSQPATSKTTQKQLPAPHPTLPARPDFPQFCGPKKGRHSDAARRPDIDGDQERPRKMRRFSSPVRAPLAPIPATGPRSSRGEASTSTSHGRENRADLLEQRAKRKGGEKAPTSTPTNTSTSKQLTDYSAFKGRGRYGKAPAASGSDTINAAYAIDPAQNGGLNFQYDAVVRGKDERRRMAGGDCECCRDYYEAIGPLPSRLQPPLWRSPPASPEKARPCRRGDAGREEITAHKQAISRHRHDWERASTPPSYWQIGFPTTQEAEIINEKAATMHHQQRQNVEAEAEGGGRYYKIR
ncbi:DNA repair protein endonuclease SAE2/CtIP C-terminus-domain-containing protein [Mycena vulgaris]|nr:DNA repair protein endonuclease SAE2/CtIP C-terminus-domain-containing protein [Mycena vulgaris]